MVAYHYYSLDKNGQIYKYGWKLNMAEIECIFERRVNWLPSYQSTMVLSLYLNAILNNDKSLNKIILNKSD